MITERDLEQAIAECQGESNPTANTCIKLAAFYTIRREMFGTETCHSFANGPGPVDTHITYTSDTDFARAIHGRKSEEIWPIIDELVNTVYIVMPRLYDGLMRKLQD